LMAGEVASLLLSRMAVPVMYHLVGRARRGAAGTSDPLPEAAAAN
ncbi:MAG: hypothetical protein HOP14_01210, partial [Acidobacteria bacterium]|nr:hypothetical protein [Acidobacteriota bacterium]